MFDTKVIGFIVAVAILASGSAANSQQSGSATNGSGLYPVEVTRFAPVDPIIRGCTQLEYSAGIPRSDCGTMTLTEIVQFMHPAGREDDDKPAN